MTEPSPDSDQTLIKIRDQYLKPVAEKFGFPLSKRTGGASSLPIVLCLGNHSSGKSSFINHLVGASIQATGVAPTDDGFTLLQYSSAEQVIDGRTAVVDPQLPLHDFEQYGKPFLDHLRVKRMPLEALRSFSLIDSPGLIDHAGAPGDLSRGYDFPAVVREFASMADLIIFFFDPGKPGTTGESLRIFTEALSDVMYKVLIVFNKVDTFEDVRDFARTYGALCWNLSRIIRTKDMPLIYCTFIDGLGGRGQRQIDLADFTKSTQQLHSEVSRVGQRRRANVIGALLDTARGLRIHASVVHRLGARLFWMRAALWLAGVLLTAAGIYGLVYYRDNIYLISAEVISLLAGIALVVLNRTIRQQWLDRQIVSLDSWFRDTFHRELLEQSHSRFWEGMWESVKPRTIKFLQAIGPNGLPYSMLWPFKLRKLREIAEKQIPQLLKSSDN
jgi:GTPase SAR1 family protein